MKKTIIVAAIALLIGYVAGNFVPVRGDSEGSDTALVQATSHLDLSLVRMLDSMEALRLLDESGVEAARRQLETRLYSEVRQAERLTFNGVRTSNFHGIVQLKPAFQRVLAKTDLPKQAILADFSSVVRRIDG